MRSMMLKVSNPEIEEKSREELIAIIHELMAEIERLKGGRTASIPCVVVSQSLLPDCLADTRAKTPYQLICDLDNGQEGTTRVGGCDSGQIACRARLYEYRYRMSIEQSFRGDESGGFNLAHIQLQHADHIECLLLPMETATL